MTSTWIVNEVELVRGGHISVANRMTSKCNLCEVVCFQMPDSAILRVIRKVGGSARIYFCGVTCREVWLAHFLKEGARC